MGGTVALGRDLAWGDVVTIRNSFGPADVPADLLIDARVVELG